MSSRVLDALRPPRLKADLASGHAVVVTGDDRVEVRNADGDVEIAIALDGEVPTVRLSGARLEIDSPDTVSVKARVFEVAATDRLDLHSDGTLDLTSKGEMTLMADEDFRTRAPCIWLN